MATLDLSDRTNMFYWQTNRNITAELMKEIFLDRSKIFDKSVVAQAIESGMKRAGKTGDAALVEFVGELITDGLVNNVLKAVMKDGSELVCRMHPTGVKNGYYWVESLAAKQAKLRGVPTYSTYMVVDDSEEFGFDYMLIEALPGETMRNFTKSGEIEYKWEEQLIRETGKYMAMIHQVNTEGFGFFVNQVAKKGMLKGQYQTFEEHIFAALDDDLKYLQDSDQINSQQQKKIMSLFEGNRDLMACDLPVLIHNDIADWNQLSDGQHVTGMIDWDECFSGDPVMEFSAYSLFFGDKRMNWIKEGYAEISAIPVGFDDKFQLFKLRYLVSKLKLRVKMATVHDSDGLQRNIRRGFEAMTEVFEYFKV